LRIVGVAPAAALPAPRRRSRAQPSPLAAIGISPCFG
jgi:hypothetical protein